MAAFDQDSATRNTVISGLHARKEYGLVKYGTVLHPQNGRNHLQDAVDETEDQLVYLRTAMDADETLVPELWLGYQQGLALLMRLRRVLTRRTPGAVAPTLERSHS